MQSTPVLDDAGWNRLIQDAAYYFDDLTLKRGFQYYKQGRVSSLQSPSAGLLTAFVDGSERYSIEMVLGAFSISSCSCPVLGPCKHMAAVLMDYAGLQGRPVPLLANAQSSARTRMAGNGRGEAAGSADSGPATRRELFPPGAGRIGVDEARGSSGRRIPADSHVAPEGLSGRSVNPALHTPAPAEGDSYAERTPGPGGASGMSGASGVPGATSLSGTSGSGRIHVRGAAISLAERGRLIPSMNIAQWHELFGQCLSRLAGETRNPRYVEEALAAILRIKPVLDPEPEKLFALHARLHVLGTLTVRSGGSPGSFMPSLGYYTHLAVTELQDGIEGILQEELHFVQEPALHNRILDTLGLLRHEMLSAGREQAFYSRLYVLLWRRWILPSMESVPLIPDELRRLEREQERLAGAYATAALTARAWLHHQLEQDGEALDLLKEAADRPGFHPQALGSFWESMTEAGEWERLVRWLKETGPLLTGYHPKILEDYARFWEEAATRLPEAEPFMWKSLTAMLPLSGDIYERLLLSRGRLRQWMDYQLSSGKDPLDFRVRDLQPLEKEAPELLLPFYHQGVERYVAEKNRAGYKTAVKLLKRLQKLYKKRRDEERFDAFLGAFSQRHSRLRALQEELRKGKLIP
ncbi:hypothetical protein KIH86_26615 [Paenibacillus sp. HN-1]|uniref:SWIM zinc finger family protein n=1 Tax=Paenibacillus TaxID=44249 RepID=UPI001CA7EAA2|nr:MULTISPECIES: SWIM zinc finger family protein [Paenibacillus]MBY9080161.1 hypothetical protein [Paenibacillus sp. CGMCC 1.18879]MBY9087765.1 hypothetical protein [Paenibacillus sinensis]